MLDLQSLFILHNLIIIPINQSSHFSHPYHLATAAAKSLQSCPTLCDPTEGSPPGSPVHGILQARMLEWVAISFSEHLATTTLISASVSLTNLYTSDKWNKAVFVFLCIGISLSIMSSRFIHVVTNGKIFFFFKQNNTSLFS